MIRDPLPAGEPLVRVVADPAAVAGSAAERVAAELIAAVAQRGRADLATTGGSSAAGLYEGLAAEPLRSRIPWDRVHLWWGDDRFVPPDHPMSNVLPVDEVLLAPERHVPLPIDHLHPWPTGQAIAGGLGPSWCAENTPGRSGPPFRSIRPVCQSSTWSWSGSVPMAISCRCSRGARPSARTHLALGIAAPQHVEPHLPRVTLNPSILTAARAILVMVAGSGKAGILARILDGPRLDPADPAGLPAQFARRATATWLLDAAAAAELNRPPS